MANTAIPDSLDSTERLLIMPVSSRNWLSQDWLEMLGQQWFAGRTGTFDHPNRCLLFRSEGDLPGQKAAPRAMRGFQTNVFNECQLNYSRIQVVIDGEQLDLLFDTGASTQPSDAALTALDDKRPATRAPSFIAESIFEKWRKRHPPWRVIENAEKDTGYSMIDVPMICVADYKIASLLVYLSQG